jgi:hypothetical protein
MIKLIFHDLNFNADLALDKILNFPNATNFLGFYRICILIIHDYCDFFHSKTSEVEMLQNRFASENASSTAIFDETMY